MSDIVVKDSNGTALEHGDSVTLAKDLKVKGTSETLKRGTLVKNIRLTGRADEVECSTRKVKGLVLKTRFLKKA
ncbi:alkylphosphonate utilization protein [Streptomyces sp. CLV115]|uniref:alkylphosphonate utilization protein n=1 Tax=Streptomyces sp. CLV115 TaxID=3138502 RepID=UPI00313D8A88